MDHCSHLGQTRATTGHPLLPVLRNPSTDDDNSDDDDDDDDDDRSTIIQCDHVN